MTGQYPPVLFSEMKGWIILLLCCLVSQLAAAEDHAEYGPWGEDSLGSRQERSEQPQRDKFWAIRGKKDEGIQMKLPSDFDTRNQIMNRKSPKFNEENPSISDEKQNLEATKRSESRRMSHVEKIKGRLQKLFNSERRKNLKQDNAFKKMIMKPNGLFGISKRITTKENNRKQERELVDTDEILRQEEFLKIYDLVDEMIILHHPLLLV